VARVQWNHVIEQLAATASYPALSDTILPGTPNRRSRTGYFHRADCGRDIRSILGVMVDDHKLGSGLVRDASRSCWMIQLLVGWQVTLKCTMRRRSWLMRKKQ